MRTEIIFKLTCSVCGSDLEADENSKETKFECDSANSLRSSIAIVPCKTCISKAEKPIKMLREVIGSL